VNSQPVLKASNLSLDYEKVRALKKISFEVSPGSRLALIGSNGAGKSTLISIIAGLLKPTEGEVLVFGMPPGTTEVKKKLRILSQNLEFPKQLKVGEVLKIVASHFQNDMMEALIEELKLKTLLKRQAGFLSGGESKRLGVACALMGDPDVVILDEPTANIDLQGRQLVYQTVQNFLKRSPSKTLILTSHNTHDIELLADEVKIIHKGQFISEGSTLEIKRKYGLKKVSFQSNLDWSSQESEHFSSVTSERLQPVSVVGENSDFLIKEILKRDPDAFDIQIHTPSLDEVLMDMWENSDARV
jgi:ABC-2 type transport system ATP-binding protein